MRWLSAALLASALAFAASPSLGQPGGPSPAERQAARGLADEGLGLFNTERYAEAFERFSKAEGIVHAPPHLLFMARCKDKLGALLAAREHYARLLAEQIADDAPAPFREAQAAARTEKAALEARIAGVTVVVASGSSAGLSLTVDGVAATFGKRVELDPGDHRVAVQGPGHPGVERKLRLADGQHERVSLEGVGAPDPLAPPTDEPSPGGGVAANVIGPAALFGLGALGLAVGTGTGVAALGKASELKDLCPSSPCAPENESLATSARGLGHASTVSFVVGGLALAGGAVWMILDPPGGAATDAPVEGRAPAIRSLALELLPGGLRLRGAM
ncbi:MAG: hypothetical protein IT373_14950 [Polyangiaceae bacterium]|nr:hypothetical protein [Polyangiaceae bacterium]